MKLAAMAQAACVEQEDDKSMLFSCLRTIFGRASEFGGGLFALAASVMTDLVHHEPTVYNALDEHGVPEAFVNAIKVR
jgi:E3 ubiquitin-protein ligase HUWE1